ncbi:EamA family transporter [Halorarius litoreus]|uniref:EamA family transporter n=1 Tax=Halorarius litoreus TaxID=2962676 RepID=UPI0020CF21C0|nr:EamA family transporter [Halorarius litoreus]
MVLQAPGEVLLLALGSGVAFGLGPVFSKRGLEDAGDYMGNTVIVVGTRAAVFWAVLLVTARLGALDGVVPATAGAFAVAGLAIGVGRFMFYKGVDDVGSTLANAFVNTRPLFAVLLAVLLLGETATPRTVAGVLAIVAGLVALSLSKGGDVAGWERVDLVLPLAAAGLFAAGNVARRFGFTGTDITTLQAVAIGDLVAFLLVATVATANRGQTPGVSWGAGKNFLLSGLCSAAGVFLLFSAFSLDGGNVAIVDPLSATAPLFTTVFAVALLRDVERITLGTVLGIAVVVGGVALVTL